MPHIIIIFHYYYRLFLGTLDEDLTKSTIHDRLIVDNRLLAFQNLTNKTRDWRKKILFASYEDVETLVMRPGAPSSKRKKNTS